MDGLSANPPKNLESASAVATAHNSIWSDIGLILVLMCLTAGVRIWLICNTEVAARDSIGFIRYALQLENQAWPEVFRNNLQHPGYPIVLLAVSQPVRAWMGGTTPVSMQLSAQVTSALASILLVIPMFYLGRELFDRRIAFWATVLFQCLPVAARAMSDGLSEATFFLFVTTALLLAVRAVRSGSILGFGLCGLFGSLAYWTRPEGAIVVLATGLVLLGMQAVPARRREWKRMLHCGASLGLTALLAAAPFMIAVESLTTKPTAKVLLEIDEVQHVNDGQPVSAISPRTDLALRIGPPRPLLAASLFASYAPGRLEDKRWWAVKAIAGEVAKDFQYFACVPLALGLWWFRGRLRLIPGAWVLAVFCMSHMLVLWRLGIKVGYVSDRHVMLLVLCGVYPAAAGAVVLSNWLATGVASLWSKTSATQLVQGSKLAVVFMAAITMFGLTEIVKPLHANRSGHRQAGLWLAAHSTPADEVMDPYCWAHYYAGRVFLEGTTPVIPPGARPVHYVVIENSESDHLRLPMIPLAEACAKIGKPVYHWPENESEREAKVVIIAATEAEMARARKQVLLQPVKKTSTPDDAAAGPGADDAKKSQRKSHNKKT